jgi:hypothetical protein
MTAHTNEPAEASPSRYRVRLPGFVRDQDIGLGDAVSRVTARFGIRPCGRCRRRAATLNRWVRFDGRPR